MTDPEAGPPPAVVADSSPLIALASIGKLEALHALYGVVVVPSAVWEETVSQGRGRYGERELRAASWVRVGRLADKAAADALRADLGLDEGEAEAIALARELRAELLVIDERRGRAAARRLGVAVIGSVGVLVQARRRGLVGDLAALLEEMRAKGIRIGDAEREAALREEARPRR